MKTHSYRRRGPRLLRLGIMTLMLLFVAGCSGVTAAEPQPVVPDNRPVVLTTFTVLADIAQNVAGEHLRVESVTRLGAEIHGYEPTPDDLRRASQADLILDNGLNLEAWFAQFVADNPAPHVTVSDDVAVIDIADEEGSGKPNPHAWMSPLNVQKYAGASRRRSATWTRNMPRTTAPMRRTTSASSRRCTTSWPPRSRRSPNPTGPW